MTISRHQLEAEALARRLRQKNLSGGGKKLKVFRARPQRKKSTAGRASRNAGSWLKKGLQPAVIAKIGKAGRAADEYMARSIGARQIMSNMLGQTPEERKAEFDLDQMRHPNVKMNRLFMHVSFSRPEGMPLTDDKWRELIRSVIKNMGAVGASYVVQRHSNTRQDHCHLLLARALPNGKLLSDSNSYWKVREALRAAENEIGLEAIRIDKRINREAHLSDNHMRINRINKRGGKPAIFIRPDEINSVILQSKSESELIRKLDDAGIVMSVTEKNGKTTGVTFARKSVGGKAISGSSIDRALSLTRIRSQLDANAQSQNDRARTAQRHIEQQRQQQRTQAALQAQRPPRPLG